MIKNIEDLVVWQKSREFCKKIYLATSSFPPEEKYGLTDQLRRAATSICANIAEGFGRYHSQESMQFYRTARGSLLEIKSHLLIAFDQKYIKEEELNYLIQNLDEIGKMLSSFIKTTKEYRQK